MPFSGGMRATLGFSGTRLLVVFLVATLVLSLWLGVQALRASRSHRATAEEVLADYASIASWEYSRLVRENLDYLDRWVFDDIPRTLRRRPPEPEVMANDLRRVLRNHRCDCEGLRSGAWFFRVGLGEATVQTYPDTIQAQERQRLASEVTRRVPPDAETRSGILTFGEGIVLDPPSLAVYYLSRSQDRTMAFVYGFVAEAAAFGELFSNWHRRAVLLPEAVRGSLPSDSVVRISVRGPGEVPIFVSPATYPEAAAASDTLEEEFGSLVVGSAIRPDAASQLIIGGLPRSRIPLLLGLMLLTMGVGIAALLQIRREYHLARLRDDFISSVSHELRTPLTQIRVFAELLNDGKLASEDERTRSMAVIDREARRLSDLVENILHFSRLRRPLAAPPVREEIDVERATSDLVDAFVHQADAQGSAIHSSVAPNLAVLADRSGFHRILSNLLDNALKYGGTGQTVRIGAVQAGDQVRISVEDQGPGIPKGDRKRVWESYRRLDRDVAGEIQGSGIGLAVVAELCSGYGGRVWVEDGDGSGARFVVELPGAGSPSGTERGPVAQEA
jgi:signal transduction histidine kinase